MRRQLFKACSESRWYFKIVAVIVSFVLVAVSSVEGKAWHRDFHKEITRSALKNIQNWPSELKIDTIVEYAWKADLPGHANHCENYAHRVGKYQEMFENLGGRLPPPSCGRCNKPGAEWGAFFYLYQAQAAYKNKDYRAAEKYLGYAIHFIQDALCPAHVFPFMELSICPQSLRLTDVHGNFESWAEKQVQSWLGLAENAPFLSLKTPNVLVQYADWVYNLPCSYIREDGRQVINLEINVARAKYQTVGDIQKEGWCMRKDDVETIVKYVAGLTKAAALFVLGR